jgi:serine/threonine protein kinase
MNYPSINEYKEAILFAEDNFEQLKNLRPVLEDDGSPVMTSGNFAVVLKMKDEQTGKLHAVKCFLREQEGRAEAYRMIAEELEYVSSTFLTPIKYLDKELFVDTNAGDEKEFPVLLMDWVEGETLDKYIRKHLDDQYELSLLAYQFSRLAMWLMPQPFAHGDLKPDNILVKDDGTLVLVDYDGMYVPAMKGQKARELGSPDFRHPSRTETDFDEHIDDFSLASILLSLKAISLQPSLLEEHGASDRLLFSEKDYRNLSESKVMDALKSLMQDAELASLYSLFILAISQNNLSQVSFRLFNLSRPERSKFLEENLSTEVTEEDLANAWTDKYRVKFSADRKRLLKASDSYNKNYLIEDGVRVIGDRAFCGCVGLISIHIPDSVTTIGDSAFSYCSGLTSIHIPDSVTTIGYSAFSGCSGLTSISVGKNNKRYCSDDSNSIIEKSSRILLTGCKNTIIPDSVTSIGDEAFSYCSGLTCIHIPDSVTNIGYEAFLECSGLTSIHIPDSITSIEDEAFSGCRGLTNIHIPDSVTSIGDEAFADCRGLTSIHIPDSVTKIGDEAFVDCSGLTTIYIPDSVTSIGISAFKRCRALTRIIIPIGTRDKFEELLSEHKDKLVEQDDENLSTEVTKEDLDNAWTDEYGAKYSKDRKRLLKVPNDIKEYSIKEGTIVICDEAFTECVYMPNLKYPQLDKFDYYSELRSVVIPDTIISIGAYAFAGCEHLQTIELSSNLRLIGKNAFENCARLKEIKILSEKLERIEASTFRGCYELESIRIPNSVKAIGDFAFYGCPKLKSILIPKDTIKTFEKILSNYKNLIVEQ